MNITLRPSTYVDGKYDVVFQLNAQQATIVTLTSDDLYRMRNLIDGHDVRGESTDRGNDDVTTVRALLDALDARNDVISEHAARLIRCSVAAHPDVLDVDGRLW